jgi:hypothetical protein
MQTVSTGALSISAARSARAISWWAARCSRSMIEGQPAVRRSCSRQPSSEQNASSRRLKDQSMPMSAMPNVQAWASPSGWRLRRRKREDVATAHGRRGRVAMSCRQPRRSRQRPPVGRPEPSPAVSPSATQFVSHAPRGRTTGAATRESARPTPPRVRPGPGTQPFPGRWFPLHRTSDGLCAEASRERQDAQAT